MNTMKAEQASSNHRPGESGGVTELLTVQDVAALLHVPVSWVYDHVRGLYPLPFLKIGKYLRFRASDIRAYIDALSANGRRH